METTPYRPPGFDERGERALIRTDRAAAGTRRVSEYLFGLFVVDIGTYGRST